MLYLDILEFHKQNTYFQIHHYDPMIFFIECVIAPFSIPTSSYL